jgi:hypothetical protein
MLMYYLKSNPAMAVPKISLWNYKLAKIGEKVACGRSPRTPPPDVSTTVPLASYESRRSVSPVPQTKNGFPTFPKLRASSQHGD